MKRIHNQENGYLLNCENMQQRLIKSNEEMSIDYASTKTNNDLFQESPDAEYNLLISSMYGSEGGKLNIVGFPLTICPVMSNSRERCSSPFPTHRASVCPKTIFHGHVASIKSVLQL